MKNHVSIFMKGMAMGVAEVIPGVSGGTIAFITGIYERLLNSIKAINPSLLGTLKKDGIRGAWNSIGGTFLVTLLAGMAFSLLAFTNLILYLMEFHKEMLWAFFFGLIAASAIYIGKQITKWGVGEIILLVVCSIAAYAISISSPATGSTSLPFVFLSGMIAICAFIMPGLSGSFVLLMMGMYKNIFGAIKEMDFAIILTFGAGCAIGILSFSHVISWAFKHYKNLTLAALTGFMIGSLNKVWPWRNVLETRLNSKGVEVPFIETSVLPSAYEGEAAFVVGVIALALVGFVLVFLLERFSHVEEVSEEGSKSYSKIPN